MAHSVLSNNPNCLSKESCRVEHCSDHKNGLSPVGPRKFSRTNSRDGLPNAFHRNQNNYRNIDPDDWEEIERFFDKKFAFQPPQSGWKLPEVDKIYTSERWKVEEFMHMKQELNCVKNKLNNFDLDSWHKHTKAMNKAANVIRTVRHQVNAELVTQAWCKFYEICDSYNLVGEIIREEKYLNSLHVCEAPGAFVTSLNHYLRLNYPEIKWNWISTTLNPYHEGNRLSHMVNDDRFILHTLEQWKFGDDYTGDLMVAENLLRLVKECRNLGVILLITADGSVDCLNDPGEQELRVSQLIFCEVVAALHILSEGGNFVVKMFTMYEAETICLMYLLVCCFEHVNVYKPATSKEGNSENYVVCLNYVGVVEMKPWLKKLFPKYSRIEPKEIMFSLEDIPKDFLNQLKTCAEKFKNYQIEVIERNIYLYNLQNNQPSLKKMKKLSFLVAEEYLKRYRLSPIPRELQIVGQDILQLTEMPNMALRITVGSFNDLQEKQKVRGVERLKLLYDDLKKTQIHLNFEEDIKWLSFNNFSCKFKVVIGKPVTSVHCSKFCLGNVLTMRNDIRNIAREIGRINVSKRKNKIAVSLNNHLLVEHESNPSEAHSELYSEELSSEIKKIIQKYDPSLLKKLKVMNYKEKLWASLESGRNEEFERTAFFDIMDLIDTLWRDESFILQGYPMLTQFTAGVIYMIGHLFEKVGFVRPIGQDFAVIFFKYRSWNVVMKNFLKELDSTIDKLGESKSVLTVVPLTEIVYGHNEFYSSVTAVNTLCVQEQNRDFILKMMPKCKQ